MSILDSFKKSTGWLMTSAEHYERAFDKGVLAGPECFEKAAGLFEHAAQKLTEDNQPEMACRALANAHLYGYLATGSEDRLHALQGILPQVPELEVIGSKTESRSTIPLAQEIAGRLIELAINQLPENDAEARNQAHLHAASVFKELGAQPLVTYPFRAEDMLPATGQARCDFHLGMADWQLMQKTMAESPEAAAEHAARAWEFFQQAGDPGWIEKSRTMRECLLKRRICYVCQREYQGEGVHFAKYPAIVAPYTLRVIQDLGQDASLGDNDQHQLVLCTPCATVIEQLASAQALRRLEEFKQLVTPAMEEMKRNLAEQAERIKDLERYSHKH